MLRRTSLSLGLVVLATTGCEDDAPFGLAERAAQVRELDFSEAVPVEKISREEYRALQEAEALEITDEDLTDLAETYGRLGYFPPSLDLRSIYAVSSDWIDAYYSDVDGKITVVGEPLDGLLIHELVHALQDQHFALGAYKDVDTTDEHLARRAVVEGDASLAADRFYAEERGYDLARLDWAPYLAKLNARADRVFAEAVVPPFFSAYPSFAYGIGERYCAHNLLGIDEQYPQPKSETHDWADEDELFGARAPASTLEVLTLDKTLPGAPVGIDDVPSALGARYVSFDTDVLGAWYTHLLLLPVEETLKADAAAFVLGIRGDRVLFVNDMTTGSRAVVFTTAWSDDDHAGRFASAMRTLHGITEDSVEPRLGTAADGEAIWLEQSGTKVVTIKNLATEDMEAMATAALSGGIPASGKAAPHRRKLLPTLRRFPAFR
ncbi:MAG: hypothetical protein HOV80_20590 [Polyangiaceae bacterium]|nr:hypothetical protein [Polyangiaceae bacterium]